MDDGKNEEEEGDHEEDDQTAISEPVPPSIVVIDESTPILEPVEVCTSDVSTSQSPSTKPVSTLLQ